MKGRIGSWLREPVVHFLVLGAVLFGAQRWVTVAAPGNRIALTDEFVRGLRQDHLRRTGEWPTAAQQEAMVERYIDTEVLYREALALGLDRGDIIVRRRLVQKMEFLLEGAEPLPDPTDDELGVFLDAHADRYGSPDRVGITHVFAAEGRQGIPADRALAEWRSALVAGADRVALGDPFMRGRTFEAQSERQLTGVFGGSFAAAVMALPVGEWSAPIRSSYGVHLVRVTERVPGRRPPLAEVRDAVVRDWRERQRTDANRAALRRLRERYNIQVAGSVEPAVDRVAVAR